MKRRGPRKKRNTSAYGDPVELTVSAMDTSWNGTAEKDGLTWHVPGTIPGDTVRVRVQAYSRHHPKVFGALEEVVSPSPDRTSGCPHWPACTGCPGIIWNYATQISWKMQRLSEAFPGFHDVQAPETTDIPFTASPDVTGYRTKVKWNCGVSEDGRSKVGVYRAGSHHLVDIPGCVVNHPDLNALHPHLEELTARLGAYDERTHTGLVRAFLAKRVSSGQTQTAVVTARHPDTREKDIILSVLARHTSSVLVNINPLRTNRLTGTQTVTLAGPDILWETDHPIPYPVTAVAFSQVNQSVARMVYDTIASWASDSCGDSCLDMYAGVGTVALALMASGLDTAMVEKEPENIRLARLHGKIGEIIPLEAENPDLGPFISRFGGVVVDPPRSGLRPGALQNIVSARVPVLIYMSCSVTSLARDAAILAQAGYRPSRIKGFDMFPHTPHFETLAMFELYSYQFNIFDILYRLNPLAVHLFAQEWHRA